MTHLGVRAIRQGDSALVADATVRVHDSHVAAGVEVVGVGWAEQAKAFAAVQQHIEIVVEVVVQPAARALGAVAQPQVVAHRDQAL